MTQSLLWTKGTPPFPTCNQSWVVKVCHSRGKAKLGISSSSSSCWLPPESNYANAPPSLAPSLALLYMAPYAAFDAMMSDGRGEGMKLGDQVREQKKGHPKEKPSMIPFMPRTLHPVPSNLAGIMSRQFSCNFPRGVSSLPAASEPLTAFEFDHLPLSPRQPSISLT